MSKEIELARTAAKGAFQLFAAKVASRIIGLTGGWILIRLLSPEDYGLMAIAMVLPGILGLFRDPGVGAAVTKYVAEYRSKNEYGKVKPIVTSAVLFRLTLSIPLTVMCLVMAGSFASILGKPYMAHLIQLAAFMIVALDLYNFASSALLGLELTKRYSFLMMLNEALSRIIPIAFVVLGMGVFGALVGKVVGVVVVALIGALISIVAAFTISGRQVKQMRTREALKAIIKYGLPLAAGGLMGAGLGRYLNFMIGIYASPKDVGYYSAAGVISGAIGYLSFPIHTVLFPTFSKIDPEEEHETLERVFKYSVQYSSLVIVPAAALTILLAKPLVPLLLGKAYEEAWLYLALLAVGWLSYGRGGHHIVNLLTSQGETSFIMKTQALTVALGVPIGFILTSNYGIVGMLLTNLTVGWPTYLIRLRKVYRSFKVGPPFSRLAKVYASSAIACLIVLAFTFLCSNAVVDVIAGALLGVAVYLAALLATKAINRYDIQNLREIMGPLPIIGEIAEKILRLCEPVVG